MMSFRGVGGYHSGMDTNQRLRDIAAQFKQEQEARPRLNIPGFADELRKQIARDSLASKIKFNRRFPGTYDIEACRRALERVYGPLSD